MAFGGHRTASTTVFKHLVNLPSMKERSTTLVFKFILRVHFLPEDTLLSMLLSFINDLPPTTRTRFRWPTLSTSNSIWSNPALTENHASTADKINFLSSPASVRRTVVAYRTQVLTSIYRKPKPPVLLSACRPYLGIDPILTLPMSTYDRSRLSASAELPPGSDAFRCCNQYKAESTRLRAQPTTKKNSFHSFFPLILSLVVLVANYMPNYAGNRTNMQA
ncbi:hypothetical protein G6F55_013339 [Rhizopus delemar]|nr:hypothetical protein G6F55_013339 [Rhizopus delemar]